VKLARLVAELVKESSEGSVARSLDRDAIGLVCRKTCHRRVNSNLLQKHDANPMCANNGLLVFRVGRISSCRHMNQVLESAIKSSKLSRNKSGHCGCGILVVLLLLTLCGGNGLSRVGKVVDAMMGEDVGDRDVIVETEHRDGEVAAEPAF
jgi:hypothetical protein